MIHAVLTWLSTLFGMDNLSGPNYGFWSGIGSDIGEVTIIGGAVMLYRHHNCHVEGCLRLGKYPVEGTPYVVCKRHHPGMPEHITYAHILDAKGAGHV